MSSVRYTNGDYLRSNPTWHGEDSSWKASHILQLMQRNHLTLRTICEVGCGAGEILHQLQLAMSSDCSFWGYEVSPQAFQLCQSRANDRLHFKLGDAWAEQNISFDVVLIVDVIEHVENYYSLLRNLRSKAQYKILHVPLELSARELLRRGALLESRLSVGHIHYFTKDTVLQTLREAGYDIVDHFYTCIAEAPMNQAKHKSIPRHIGLSLRKVLSSFHPDLAARALGGYSLMVLAT